MRNLPIKVLFSVFAAAVVASGCHCGGTVTTKSLGALAVLYPDPADATTEISSDATENTATYDFSAVFQGQTATMPVKAINNGKGSLNLSDIEIIEGADIVSIGDVKAPTPIFDVAFVKDSSVEAGGEQDIQVTFAPPTIADLQKDYSVVLKLKATNAEDGKGEVTLTIKGTGVAGVCNLDKVIDFGAVAKGDVAQQTVIIRNPSQLETTAFVGDVFGSDAPAFTFTTESARGSITLPSGAEKKVTIAFSPTELRPYFAFVKMRAAAACPEVTVQLTGTGVDSVLTWYWVKPDNTQDKTQVDFGYASPGVEVQREITFENLGKADVNVSDLHWNQSEFKVIGEAGAVDPTKLVVPGAKDGVNGTKKLPVAVKPALLGPRLSTLTFKTSLSKQPTGSFKGKAFGGGPDIDVKPSPTLAFGKVAYFPNASTPFYTTRKITVQNLGTAPVPPDPLGNLHVDSVIDIAPLSGVQDTSEITATLTNYAEPAGLEARVGYNTAFVEVKITPTSVGQKSWEVTIKSNDNDEPAVKVIVSADVQIMPPCTYSVVPGNVDFGLVSPPQYKDLNVAIKNTGTTECLINNVGIKAGSDATFSLPGGPIDSATIAAGDQLTVTVRALPTGTATSTLNVVHGDLEFYANSDVKPYTAVSLQATIAQGCLTIAPSDLDFGTVQRGCSSSTRTFSIYNTCSTPTTVNSITITNPAGYAQGQNGCTTTGGCPEFTKTGQSNSTPFSIPAGSSTPLTFTAKYVPLDLGADQGTVAITATQNGQPVTYIVTLAGKGDTVGQNTDVFSQDAKPKADILLVIDDSCSMDPYQQALGSNFQSFIQYAQAAGVDYNIAVVTADDDDADSGKFISGATHPEKILTPNTPNVEAKFTAKVNVGTDATYIETCLAPALKALTSPLVTTDNAGFIRTDAKLAVVCVTDAPDQSGQSATYYYNAMMNIKGYKSSNAFTFNAIAGFNPSPPATCNGYDSGPDDGKYTYMVSQTNGVKDEICTPNWSTTLQQLGKTAFGFRTTFFLNATPDLTGGKVIDVKIDGVSIPSTDSRGATVWSYDSVTNAVNFEPSYVPEPGQTMTVTYFVTCYAP